MPILVASTEPAVSLEEFKRHLNLSTGTSESDEELALHLDAALRAVEKRIGPLVQASYTEEVRATTNGRLILEHSPVVELTSITSSLGEARDLTKVVLDEPSGVVRGTVGYPFAAGAYDVVYTAGHGVTALSDHKLAVLYVAEHLWEMQQGSGVGDRPSLFGDEAPANAEAANYVYRGFALPRRALELLADTEHQGIA